MTNSERIERARSIARMRERGMTYKEIAGHIGVCAQRVPQIERWYRKHLRELELEHLIGE